MDFDKHPTLGVVICVSAHTHITYTHFQLVPIQNEEATTDDVIELVEQIVAFHMKVLPISFFILNCSLYFRFLFSTTSLHTGVISKYYMFLSLISALQHNAEPEAVDLLMEVYFYSVHNCSLRVVYWL